MPTNTIKHRMLMEAKKIANITENKIEILRGLDGSIIDYSVIPSSLLRDERIRKLLDNHPEYDEDIFRGMIRTFQKKDNSNELSD